MKIAHKIKSISLLGVAAAVLLSCQKEDKTAQAPAMSRITVVHLGASTSKNLEIYLGNVSFGNNNRKGNIGYTSAFTVNPAGTKKVQLRLTDEANAVVSGEPALVGYEKYTALFTQVSQTATENPAMAAMLLKDNLNKPETGKVKVRFVHLGIDAPAVDVYIFPSSDTTPTVPTYSNVSFAQASNSSVANLVAGQFSAILDAPFLELAKGTYKVELRETGSNYKSNPYRSSTFTFLDGRCYTILARGYATPPSFAPSGRTLGMQALLHDLTTY